MAGNFAYGKDVFLKNVRLQWAGIFQAESGEINGKKTEPKFKVVALFDPASETAGVARTAILTVAKELWGPNAENVVANISANSKAVRNGNSKIDDNGTVRPEFKDQSVRERGATSNARRSLRRACTKASLGYDHGRRSWHGQRHRRDRQPRLQTDRAIPWLLR